MRQLAFLCAVFLTVFSFTIHAQQTAAYTNPLEEFHRAVLLFKDKQYQSAQILFKKAKETTSAEVQSDCDYYIATCAIRLNQVNAEALMEHFILDHPTSSKHNQAYLDVAQYYFEEGKFPQALQWFERVSETSLTTAEKDKYYFQKGYAFFSAANKREATAYFKRVENTKEFGSQAKYYLGYMLYESDNYPQAINYFDQVESEDKYKDRLSYYQADMHFKVGDFNKAISSGLAAMEKSDPLEKSELNKILGESHFNLKQYDQAIPYLKAYKGKNGKWTHTDFYLFGYSYYKLGDFENAITQFNKIIAGKDGVAQNAYYHLGESYLKTDRKQQALNAFKNASEMGFDVKIQEDAFLNYAKLSYELGNPYQSVPDVLTVFLYKYPNTPHKQEVETLLINAYITSKNYKEALVLLEKNNSFENKQAYQKVAFYRALELLTDGNNSAALMLFKKSLGEPRDPKFTARAMFWKGETEYSMDNFVEALLSFKQFLDYPEAKATPEYKNSNYNVAYTYFKLKEYQQAATYFQKQIEVSKEDKNRLKDSYLRLGDSHFVSSKYWPAMEAYNKAIELKVADADYASFQKAISYGFVSRNEKKIDDLNLFLRNFPKSQYRDDALFELGNTYTIENKTDLAIKTYDQLIADYPTSLFAAKAILRQGLIYYNSNRPQLALTKLKKVAADYPRTTEALEAVTTARQIYMDTGKVDEYANWVGTLDYIEVSTADIEATTFEAAEKMYLQNNTKGAISGFSSYVTKFPNGVHALKATFYLAQLYFADGLETNAVPHYSMVVSKPRSEFTEQALARLAEIHLKKKTYLEAIATLKRLEIEADFPQNVTFAQSNLMKVYYEQGEYANAVVYAEKVLNNPKVEDRIKSDAQLIVARSAMQTNEISKAKTAYAALLPIAKGELAAEALYFDAYFKHLESKWEASNSAVQKLTKDYSGYKYYGAKGLVLMAKNFYKLNDSFQATYILESLIANFKEYPDVVEEAQKELLSIKSEEAKRNASIQN